MKLAHNFYQNSQCLNQYLHRFEIKEEYPEGVLEVCEICHTKKFFRIIDGKVDNVEYMSYHIRQSLPPYHPLFDREWKYKPLEESLIESPYV